MSAAAAAPSAPKSLKSKTFTQLSELKDKVLSEDYVHDTFETWKIKGTTSGSGKWDLKGKIKNFNQELGTELKVQFPWNRYWFWLGVQSAGKYNFKFHVDAGNFLLFGKDFNLFANVKTQTNFNNFLFRFGANYWGSQCESNTRLEVGHFGGNENQLTQRTLVRRGSFFYGFVGTIGFQGWNFHRYDAILGYEHDNVNFYLQHKSSAPAGGETKDHGLKLGTVSATAVVSRDKNDFGVEVARCSRGYCFAFGAQSNLNSTTTLKGKLNCDLDLAFAYKKKFNNNFLTLTTSGLLHLANPDKIFSGKGLIPIPLGFQFELNI